MLEPKSAGYLTERVFTPRFGRHIGWVEDLGRVIKRGVGAPQPPPPPPPQARHFVTRPRPIPRASNMASDTFVAATATSTAYKQAKIMAVEWKESSRPSSISFALI